MPEAPTAQHRNASLLAEAARSSGLAWDVEDAQRLTQETRSSPSLANCMVSLPLGRGVSPNATAGTLGVLKRRCLVPA